ncbi:MAG: ATP-binding protein [Planctomycetes bacterium]|nr:ATP-binding protein [Planctomycetota bacterium]
MGAIVNTENFVDEISQNLGFGRDQVSKALAGVRDFCIENLAKGEDVGFAGFAKLKLLDKNNTATVTIPQADTIGQITKDSRLTSQQAQQVVMTFLDKFRVHLLQGQRVNLDNFISVMVVEEKAKIVKDEISGQRLIAPSKNRISFGLHEEVRARLSDAPVAFLPAKTLKEQMQQMKTSSILLVVPGKDFFTDIIEYHFRKAGWVVDTTTDTAAALEHVGAKGAYLVLLDMNVKGAAPFIEKLKLGRTSSLIPLMMMFAGGTDVSKPTGFRICGNESLVQPFEVKNLLTVAEAELARAAEEEIIFEQEVQFQFPTDDAMIDKAFEVAASLFEGSGLDEEGQVALSAAFREAVQNAAQHGNRYRHDKIIDVLYLLDKEKITLNITDQGAGFDHRNYIQRGHDGNAIAAARERHAEGKMGGLGIMLMLKCCDRIEYNEAGNAITLTKFLDSNSRG